MNRRYVSNVILMSIFVVTVSNLTILASDNKNTHVIESFSFMKSAYAQNANSGNDNYTGLGISSDNPMASVGLSDNSTNAQNTTSSATTPEFGSIVQIVLVISIISIVLISARTKLRLN